MARVFITGGADGLGRAAALSLLGEGHDVVLHVRSPSRRPAVAELADRAAGVVVGDLRSAADIATATLYAAAISTQLLAGLAMKAPRRCRQFATNRRSPRPDCQRRLFAIDAPVDMTISEFTVGPATQAW